MKKLWNVFLDKLMYWFVDFECEECEMRYSRSQIELAEKLIGIPEDEAKEINLRFSDKWINK